jgi:PAS domain-containing protein
VRTYADVTDYMQAIADRSASEAVWKFALEGSGAGVWDWDPVHAEGRYSPLYKTLLGYPADLPGCGAAALGGPAAPGRPPGRDGGAAAHYAGGSPTFVSEHRVRCRDGSIRWMHERGMVVSRDAQGAPPAPSAPPPTSPPASRPSTG